MPYRSSTKAEKGNAPIALSNKVKRPFNSDEIDTTEATEFIHV